jgi:hypothetical protein
MFGPDVVLPDGAVLLHIGPFKTGTTSLQAAFDAAAPRLLDEYGIWWASPDRRRLRAAVATLTGGPNPFGHEVGVRRWRRLVRTVADAADQRVVISNEWMSEADAATSAKIVRKLGGQRVHVVITLRPISAILPSQWQQFAQSNLIEPYEQWLRTCLEQPERAGVFWRRHDHAALVERWAAAVGPDNLCVIALDEAHRDMVTASFEQLLQLEAGLLVPPTDLNRSMTGGEIELVRRIIQLFEDRGWTDFYDPLIRQGAVRRMMHNHRPDASEPRITTPSWALDRARDIGRATAERIEASGVRVIGDLASLAWTPPGSDLAAPELPQFVAVEAAFQAILGVIDATRITTAAEPPPPLRGEEALRLRELAAKPLGPPAYVDLSRPHQAPANAPKASAAKRRRRRA